MIRTVRRLSTLALAVPALLLGACTTSSGDAPDTAAPAAQPAATGALPAAASTDSTVTTTTSPESPSAATSTMRLEVDVAARKLYVYEGDRRIATHGVAVGSAQWPTKTGSWHVTQVVWNPEWTPPDESWAEQREPRQPGDPKNPLGRAQLIYDPPRTIHGTNEPASIGKAVSHGSIRVTNDVAVSLARQLMEATGAGKDEAWYKETQAKRTVKQIVDLPQRVPIRVF
jgi:lipoprotein-anchoring transpeptidase ErfK/SrfK